MTYGCLGIHQSSTVQRYHIYRLTEYIRHMFTMESPRGNLLIQMQLILACKVHILVHFFVFESFPIHAGDCWILKKVWMENEELRLLWRVVTFMKCCDFDEKLWLLWKVATSMKSNDYYEKLRLLWRVVTFMKIYNFYERLWPFQRVATSPDSCNLSDKTQ